LRSWSRSPPTTGVIAARPPPLSPFPHMHCRPRYIIASTLSHPHSHSLTLSAGS
jgi:hypothetical protein